MCLLVKRLFLFPVLFLLSSSFFLLIPPPPSPPIPNTQLTHSPPPHLTLNTPNLNFVRHEHTASGQEALRLGASHSHSDGIAALQLTRAHPEVPS